MKHNNYVKVIGLLLSHFLLLSSSLCAQQWKVFDSSNSPIPVNAGLNTLGYDEKLIIDYENRVWMAFEEGITLYAEQKNEWLMYNSDNSPLTAPVTGMLADGRSIWAVHFPNGIFRFDGSDWHTISTSQGGKFLEKDLEDNLWIHSAVGLFYKYDGNTITDASDQLPDPFAWAFRMDTDTEGKVWIAQYNDLDNESMVGQVHGNASYSTSDAEIFHYPVWQVEFTADDNLWVGTFTFTKGNDVRPARGVAYLDRETGIWTSYHVDNSPLPDNEIRDLKSDAHNRTWIATNNGLARFDGHDWKVYNKSNSPLPNDTVTAIAIDTLGTKWLGTPHGLVRFNEITPAFDQTECGPSALSFTDQSQSIDGAITAWRWDFGGLGASVDRNPVFTFPQAGQYTITLFVTDAVGTQNFIQQEITVGTSNNRLSLGPDIDTCQPSIQLSSNIHNADSYQWQTPEGLIEDQSTVSVATPGQYILEVNTANCVQKDTIDVILNHFTEGSYTITAGSAAVEVEGIVLSDVALTFTNTTGTGEGFGWSFGDDNTSVEEAPVYTYNKAGQYVVTLRGIDSRDCPITVEKTIQVADLFITNAISPNGDGKNDKLFVEPSLYRAELKVVNRWGQEVYQTSSYNDDFTGTGLESGVYYYELYFKEIDKSYKGYFHIMK